MCFQRLASGACLSIAWHPALVKHRDGDGDDDDDARPLKDAFCK
jgi:hypothetical protein